MRCFFRVIMCDAFKYEDEAWELSFVFLFNHITFPSEELSVSKSFPCFFYKVMLYLIYVVS